MSEEPLLVDLLELHNLAGAGGPLWGCARADLNLTLLSWPEGHSLAPHVNLELEVVLIGIAGTGRVMVDDEAFDLAPGRLLVIPAAARRGMTALSHWSYLSLHRRRTLNIQVPGPGI